MTNPIDPASVQPAPKLRLEDLIARDPVLRDKLAAQKKEAQTAIDTLKQSRIDLVSQRKAMAMQQIQRIKASIAALKLSGIIDSRMLARMAARLARELAGAVKDYIAAGGKPDLVNFTSDVAKTSTDIAVKGDIDEKPSQPNSSAFVDAIHKEIKEAAGKYAAQQNPVATSSVSDEDRAFNDLVRSTIEDLRKILKGHKAVYDALGRREDPEFDEAEKSLREVERLLGGAGGNVVAVLPSPDTHQFSVQS